MRAKYYFSITFVSPLFNSLTPKISKICSFFILSQSFCSWFLGNYSLFLKFLLDSQASEWVLASGRVVSRGGWVATALHVVAVLLGSERGLLLWVIATPHVVVRVVRGHRHWHRRNIWWSLLHILVLVTTSILLVLLLMMLLMLLSGMIRHLVLVTAPTILVVVVIDVAVLVSAALVEIPTASIILVLASLLVVVVMVIVVLGGAILLLLVLLTIRHLVVLLLMLWVRHAVVVLVEWLLVIILLPSLRHRHHLLRLLILSRWVEGFKGSCLLHLWLETLRSTHIRGLERWSLLWHNNTTIWSENRGIGCLSYWHYRLIGNRSWLGRNKWLCTWSKIFHLSDGLGKGVWRCGWGRHRLSRVRFLRGIEGLRGLGGAEGHCLSCHRCRDWVEWWSAHLCWCSEGLGLRNVHNWRRFLLGLQICLRSCHSNWHKESICGFLLHELGQKSFRHFGKCILVNLWLEYFEFSLRYILQVFWIIFRCCFLSTFLSGFGPFFKYTSVLMWHCNLVFHVSSPILRLFIILFTFAERSHLVSLLCKMPILSGCLHDIVFDLHGTLFVLFRNFAMVDGRCIKFIRVSRLFARKLIKVAPSWTIKFFKCVECIRSRSRQPRCFLKGPFSRHCAATLLLRSLCLWQTIGCWNNGFVFLLLHRKVAVVILLLLTCRWISSFFASWLLILLLLAAIIIALICTTLEKRENWWVSPWKLKMEMISFDKKRAFSWPTLSFCWLLFYFL